MDTKMTGIVFELDKEAYLEKVKKGISKDKASMQATKAIMVFDEDPSKNQYLDISSYVESAKETKVTETLKKAAQNGIPQSEVSSYYSGDAMVIDAIDRAQNKKAYLSTAAREAEAEKIIKEATTNAKKKGTRLSIAALTVLLVGGLAACSINKEKADENEVAIEMQLEEQDWAYYFAHAEETLQKDLFVNNIAKWTTTINAAEDWEKVTLTEEEMKEYGYDTPECIFGFTAEEAHSLALRYNNYTVTDENQKVYYDQYVTINGGQEFDVISLVSSPKSISNTALSKIQTYYFHSEECDLNIENILTFSEKGQDKIDELEGLFREYKILEKDEEKEDEAKEKMAEIKHVLLECAYDTEFDQDAKSYILGTFLPTASRISEMHQYQDTIEIDLYDTKHDKNVTKEIKTALFDEITNRALRLGFAATENVGSFDSESFLENHNIDANRYNLLNVDVERSITDQLCGQQAARLEEANKYIADLRSENLSMEVSYAGAQNIDLSSEGVSAENLNNVESKYDKLIKGTRNSAEIIELLNDYLKEKGIYPENTAYFMTTKISQMIEEYKNTHGITAGKPGDEIRGETTHKSVTASDLSSGVVYNSAGEVVSAEQAMAEARQQNEQETGVYDASTPEAEKEAEEKAENSDEYKNRTALLQGVYDATYNYFYGQTVRETSYSYDSSWASSSDAEIKNRHDTAKNQALDRLAQEEAARKENEEQQNQQPVIDDEFKDAEISNEPIAPTPEPEPTPAPAPTPEPTPEPTPAPPAADEIIYDEGFEDAEIVGDIVIGDASAQAVSEETTTQAPVGLAPVVDTTTQTDSSIDYITVEEIDSFIENMTDEEWAAFVETGEVETVKTK